MKRIVGLGVAALVAVVWAPGHVQSQRFGGGGGRFGGGNICPCQWGMSAQVYIQPGMMQQQQPIRQNFTVDRSLPQQRTNFAVPRQNTVVNRNTNLTPRINTSTA